MLLILINQSYFDSRQHSVVSTCSYFLKT